MSSVALGRLQTTVRNRGGGVFTCVGGAVCVGLVAAALPELLGPTGTASEGAMMTAFFVLGLFLLYLGAVMISTRVEFFERGVVKRSMRGTQTVRYAELEWLRYQSMKVQSGPVSAMRSVTLILQSRASGSKKIVAILHEGAKGLPDFASLTAAAVDPIAARLGAELERTGKVTLACGLTLTSTALDYGGVSIPLARLSYDFEPRTATLQFRSGGQPAFKVQRDEANMLPLLKLVERRAAQAA